MTMCLQQKHLFPALALALILPAHQAYAAKDYGDAPSSYGVADHELDRAITSELETVTLVGANASWQTVSLINSYTTPVVVCTNNLTAKTDPPAVVRVRNAGANSFELRLQNPGDGSTPSPATVRCLVAESGIHSLNGLQFEAYTQLSTLTAGNHNWSGKSQAASALTNTYSNPVVLGQVMTFNDANWSAFYSDDCASRKNPPATGNICLGKHVGKDPITTRADETLGYIVIEQGSGSGGNIQYEAVLGAQTVRSVGNNPPYTYTLTNSNHDFVVATQSAMTGGQGSWGLLWGTSPISNGRLDLSVDEDQLGGITDRKHSRERIAYWAFHRSAYLGQRRDADAANQSSANADADDNTGADDDDGVVFSVPANSSNATIDADVTITKPAGVSVTVCGWLDIPSGGSVDGVFDASDGQCATTTSNSVSFHWSGLPNDKAYTTYARFRVSTATLTTANATGSAVDGEVEDYKVMFNFSPTAVSIGKVDLEALPVSELFSHLKLEQMPDKPLQALLRAWAPDALQNSQNLPREQLLDALRTWLDPDGDGQVVIFRWETLEERGTIGFYAERRMPDGDWMRINKRLLPGLLTAPLGGEYLLADPGAEAGVPYEYRLIEQEARGSQRIYGPYSLAN